MMADVAQSAFGGGQELGVLPGGGQLEARGLGFKLDGSAVRFETRLGRQIGIFALGGRIGGLDQFSDFGIRGLLQDRRPTCCPGKP